MQDKFDQSSQEDAAPALREALAAYFERQNGDEQAPDPVSLLGSADPAEAAEWPKMVAFLELPRRAAPLDADRAWQSFQARAFQPAIVPAEASLGSYVAEQLAASERTALVESGLPRPTLEALKADPTPLNALKGYELQDYVALARRYGVKDNTFPRMLKWLKGLGKQLLAPPSGPARGMLFAREDEPASQPLTEMELAEKLAEKDKDQD